jgi:outer membrane lipoprotein SlyB
MKTTVALLALIAVTQTAQAQSLRPETAGGALLGGIAGAIIGNNSGDLNHNAWRGAAIGTVAGGLIGSAVGSSRDRYYSHEVPVPHPARYGRNSYDYSYRYSPSYRYGYDHSGYYSPSYSSYYREPVYYSSGSRNRASTGLLLGGIAGAIIGHNSGDLRHNAWRGAAIGAGSGWLLGAIADERARERNREQPIVYAPETSETTAPAQQTVPQTVIINNNYYGTASSMSSANSLFGR